MPDNAAANEEKAEDIRETSPQEESVEANESPENEAIESDGADSEQDAEASESDAPAEKVAGKDAEVLVEKTNEELRATIQIFPHVGDGQEVTVDMVKAALEKAKVSFGVDEDAITQTVEDHIYMKPVQVARGIPATDGQDAQIVYHYSKHIQKQDRSVTNLDRIDYKEMNAIINVRAEDLLIEKIPATMGSEGQAVTGRVIRQNKGKDLKLRSRNGVKLSEDGLRFYAEIDGQVTFRNNEVKVEPVYEAEAVDATTGNVRFIGSVIIKTIVEDGYVIESSGDVKIAGSVGAANIVSESDITIAGGVLGGGNCRIESKNGTVYCKFIQDAVVIAKSNIIVEEYVKNSKLQSGGNIEVLSENMERGFIIGGKTSAVDKIECNNIGSPAGIRTEIQAGFDGRMLDQMIATQKEFYDNGKRISELSKLLQKIQAIRHAGSALDEKKKELFLNLLKALIQTRLDNYKQLEVYHESLLQLRADTSAKVRVKNQCYPNVSIFLNGAHLENHKQVSNVLFKNKDGLVQQNLM